MLPAGGALGQHKGIGTDSFRKALSAVYTAETGVKEATGNNDGERVGAYLRYTHLSEGYDWCAAFVSWCFGRTGRQQPRNPWSPALFPQARLIWRAGQEGEAAVRQGDVFGIYNTHRRRIAHVGFIDDRQGDWWITVEGNVGNAVRRLRRHKHTVYCIADWAR